MAGFALGLDFGTLSVRALIAEIGTGREAGTAVMEYPHAVMDRSLPCGKALEPGFALQHPGDYLDCMEKVIPQAMREAGITAGDIVGIGIDFTACTMLPVDESLTPLCMKSQWEQDPHAWVKLWKHHGAQEEANRISRILSERGDTILRRYGGKASSERMFPKVWETLNKAPEVYAEADSFLEAGDWIVACLTGRLCRSGSLAGYKALWKKGQGYPDKAFFRALDPRLENVIEEKFKGEVLTVGTKAGTVCADAAARFGLREGTPVAVCNVDAHVALPAAGITEPGNMLMILGTFACHIMLGKDERLIPGMCGVVEDGVVPGFTGYEAGQSCLGDHFDWFVHRLLPEEYAAEARAKGIDAHTLLSEKAARLRPGQSGLIALDWWNGNRSVLVEVDLSGLIIGMTLLTRAEEIYRALIEATAYGTRRIIEAFEESGVPVGSICASGGIAYKNPFLMQVFSDVTGREIRSARSRQSSALGSAMFGAAAAGKACGGYDSIEQAAAEMGGTLDAVYRPEPENRKVYDRLYGEYRLLHDHFGRGGNDVMKRLKAIQAEQSGS
ncbi:MAG: ribulokinase [Clostridia bacterium]|nr:ribulokinase [Clostridia bacterium]